MIHAIHRIERFDIVGAHTLSLDFADGARQEIDFRSVLEGQVLGALQVVALFNSVRLDAENWCAPVAERRRLRSRDAAKLAELPRRLRGDDRPVARFTGYFGDARGRRTGW